MLRLFLLSFGVSFFLGYLLLRWDDRNVRASDGNTRRTAAVWLGGACLFGGLLAGLIAASHKEYISSSTTLMWVTCLLPVFAAGLAQDLIQGISPAVRLLAACSSGALAFALLDATLSRADIIGLDVFLVVPAVAFALTCLAIGGVSHAIHMIDGLNGLASGVCLMALFGLAYVSFQVSDKQILLLCWIGAATLIGFLHWNYPSGRISMGDAGAYFMGAFVAILSTLLVHRHQQVSVLFPAMLLLYPIWDALFSACRQRFLRSRPASSADRLQLHTLFYERAAISTDGVSPHNRRDADASASVLLFAGSAVIPATLWWDHDALLSAAALGYVIVYVSIYRRLVRSGKRALRGKRTALVKTTNG